MPFNFVVILFKRSVEIQELRNKKHASKEALSLQRKNSQIKLGQRHLIEMIFPQEVPSSRKNILVIVSPQRAGCERHMNTYQGRRASWGKITSIKRHYPSLVSKMFPPSIGSGYPNKCSCKSLKDKYKQLYQIVVVICVILG